MRILKFDVIWKKYKYAVIIVLSGVILMLLPRFGSDTSRQETEASYDTQLYSLTETESKMETILSQIDGVGRLPAVRSCNWRRTRIRPTAATIRGIAARLSPSTAAAVIRRW